MKRLIDLYLDHAPSHYNYASIERCKELLLQDIIPDSIKMNDPYVLADQRVVHTANDIWIHCSNAERYSLLGIKQGLYQEFQDFDLKRIHEEYYLYDYITKKNKELHE